MLPLMKLNLPVALNVAAGVCLTLAAFLITACGPGAGQETKIVTNPASTPVATASTRTPLPATSTPTPIPATPTTKPLPTATATPTATQPPPSPTFIPTATATLTRPASASAAPSQAGTRPTTKIYETTVTLPTYPIWDYLIEQVDPLYNIPVFYFNRLEYEAAAPTPTPVDYPGVVLENDYLKLTFLPELGGRLYSAVAKPTGQEIFYHNPVVKPSRYGVLQPWEANWWLATGGMEWAYPVQEHGYRWGVPWDYETSQSPTGATIILSDAAPGRVGVDVAVTLPADSAAFTVRPRLTNDTAQAVPVQLWLNAALTLGSASMSPDTQFIVPADNIVVHSRGEAGWQVPETGAESTWPLIGLTDLSDYSQWTDYLGFFVPEMKAPFIGAYNPDTGLGVVRLIEPDAVPGTKLFAFGLPFMDRSYTDDESQYFEIWGGANAGFWPADDVELPPGQSLQWQEDWWPLPGLGGLTWANQNGAIHLGRAGDTYDLSFLAPQPQQGTLTVLAGERSILNDPFAANPAELLRWDFSASDGPIRIRVEDENGGLLLDYCPDC